MKSRCEWTKRTEEQTILIIGNWVAKHKESRSSSTSNLGGLVVGSLESGDLGVLLCETLGNEGARGKEDSMRREERKEGVNERTHIRSSIPSTCCSARLDGVEVKAALETEGSDQ